MEKISAWLFLLIAVVWLLPLIGVTALSGNAGSWIATISLAIIGITEVVKGK